MPALYSETLREITKSMKTVKKVGLDVDNSVFPRFDTLRWVPVCYRRILPLSVMKRYHCLVIGAAQGKLTVAMTDPVDVSIIEFLQRLTRCTIFPVLIAPNRMRQLIRHLEYAEQHTKTVMRLRYQPRLQIRGWVVMGALLLGQEEKR
jgi:hypothetical protein